MNALFPFIAAVLQAASFTTDKAILNIRRISYKTYTAVSFPLLVTFDLIIFFIIRPPVTAQMFSGTNGLIVLLSVASLIVTNLLYYRALKDDHLSEINVISLTAAIPVILVNGLIFADERRLVIIIPALIASLAVLWSHWEEGRLHFARHTPAFLWWLLFTAPLNAAAAKVLLTTWSPITLELVRDACIAIVLFPLFRNAIRGIAVRGWLLFLLTNALSSLAWILYFYGYQSMGIIYTGLVFSLQPLLTYFFALLILKESFVPRKFVAFIVVLASIIVAQVLR